MKRLTLIRHAKSDWANPGLADHDRPLNARGQGVAPAVGEALAERGKRPDLVLSSTALRAASTATVIAGKLDYPADAIRYEADLYHASTSDLEGVLRGIDDSATIGHAMVFGHNPGMEDFLDYVIGSYAKHRFVTCAVAELELAIEYWGEVGAGCGKLLNFFAPRDLA